MKFLLLIVATTIGFFCSFGHAAVFSGAMDDRAGLPNIPGFTAQSLVWIVGGSRGEGVRLEWQADDVTTPGFWTYTYKLIRGSARNKGFAYFDIETASDFSAANIINRQLISATDKLGSPVSSSAITISDPVAFNAVHDFSNAALSESSSTTVLSKTHLSHYSGDPGRVAIGQPGGAASATPSVGPAAHPFYGMRVTFPGSFANLAYVASDWSFRIITDRVPMWGHFFGWGDQTSAAPYWYANFYNDAIDAANRLMLAPTNSLDGADPFRGWILVPGLLPSIIETNPAELATQVPTVGPITATFSGLMDPASISTSTFTLSDITNAAVSGVVSYDEAGKMATFTPAAPLSASTYTATISIGARDQAGNHLAAGKVWSFTTSATDLAAPTITMLMPDNGARNISSQSSVTALFSEAIEPATLTTASFALSDNSGPLAGIISYTPETRTASFTPATPLGNNTVYTATVSTAVTDRSGNHLQQDKVWRFTTIPQETVLPLITSTTPTDGAGNVSAFNPVTAVFSEAMDPATVNSSTFTLAGVTGAVSYDGATLTARFAPDVPLANSTTYTASISTAMKDLAGNSLPLTRNWSFTTGPPDSVPPTVVSVQPAANSINMPLSTTLSAVFSEPMNLATIGTGSFTLTGRRFTSETPFNVSGSIVKNTFTPIAQFAPSLQLFMGTTYTATISSSVTDQAGNHLAVDKTWSFVTMPDGILTPGAPDTTVADALKALRIALNLIVATPDDMNHGDVAPFGPNGAPLPDGIIDIRDALVILRKAVGLVSW